MNDIIFYFFYNFAHQNNVTDNLIIFLAVYLPYVVIVLAGLFLLFHHEVWRAENPLQVFLQKKKEIFLVFFSGIFAWVVARLLKFIIHTPRPFDLLPDIHSLFPESGYAFPSGHATFYTALAIAVFFYHKKAGCVFLGLAVVIGLARVAGGVHFPVDILGGLVLGSLISYFLRYR